MSYAVNHISPPLYGADGSGRDAYIRLDNGGNTISNDPTAKGFTYGSDPNDKFRLGMGKYSLGAPRTFSNSPKARAPPHYRVDGTGRDSYIFNDNGGFLSKDLGTNSFEELLRRDYTTEETTAEYLQKRNRRMSKFLSPDRRKEIALAKQSGHNRLNDPLGKANGFVINHQANFEKLQKEKFQYAHSHFLSKPKKVHLKFVDLSRSIDSNDSLKSELKEAKKRYESKPSAKHI